MREHSEGFSGSDIDHVVKDVLYEPVRKTQAGGAATHCACACGCVCVSPRQLPACWVGVSGFGRIRPRVGFGQTRADSKQFCKGIYLRCLAVCMGI